MKNYRLTLAAVEILNDLLRADSRAVHRLASDRVVTNKEVADHLHVTVATKRCRGRVQHKLGMLGVLNGVLARLNATKICPVYNKRGEITHFRPLSYKN